MKKPPVMFALSLLAVLTAAVSCSLTFDPPTKVRVKTDAAFAFTTPKIGEDNVVHYFDDIVKDSMAGQDDMQIFDYAPPDPEWGDVKAYLIRYEVEQIKFTIEKVEIEDFGVDSITLAEIEVPKNIGGGVDVTFNGGLPVPTSNDAINTVPLFFPFNFTNDNDVKHVKIKTGTLEIAAFDSGDVSGLDYSALKISLDGSRLDSGGDGKYKLDGKTITASTAMTISGDITGPSVTLSKITITPNVQVFEEVEIQTVAAHSGSKSSNIDLSGIPDGVNFVTFDKIGVKLNFSVTRNNNGKDNTVTIAGLPVKIKAPLLALDETQTVNENSFQNGLAFTKSSHTLYKNSDDYSQYNTQYPGVKIEETDNTITVNINPMDDGGNHALITLKNLLPGEFVVSVEPETILELDSVNVDLNKFVTDEDTQGSFPGDEGLNMADMFDSMGVMGENIAFNRLDLYLYMGGDRELLRDTTFTLTAQTEAGGAGTKLAENEEFANLSSGPPPNFDAISDAIYSSTLANEQFYTKALVDVINDRPSNLQIAYDINLADHLQIDNANDLLNAETGRYIEIQPELILVMPLQLRLIDEDGDGYGSMKLTETKPVANPGPGDDMFGRKGPDDEINDYLEQLGQVRLRVDYDNFMGLDGTSFYIVSKDFEGETNWEKSVTLREGAEQTLVLELGSDDMTVYPFRPGLEIRVQNKGGENYGPIEIKRGGEETGGIWAKISIETDAHVDMVVDL